MSIQPGIMLTKLLPPHVDAGMIERPRLLELLSPGERGRIVLLTAPAGYGKTVLMLQVAQSLDTPAVWYQLDSYDNDPSVFLQYLVTGIRRHLPDFGREVLQTTGQGSVSPRLRLLATALVNELTARAAEQGLTLVLDDYHTITEPTVHRLLQEFLDHLPPGVRVLVASRTAPPLSLSRLTIAGELVTIGADKLRFTRPEISAFVVQRQKVVPEQLIETLEARTAGWPAALRLAGLSLSQGTASLPPDRGRDRGHPAKNSAGNSAEGAARGVVSDAIKNIYDYLAAEVLHQQPENVRSFLVATSVLDVMTAENCDLLLGRADSRQILGYLEKQQLFLIPLAGEEGEAGATGATDAGSGAGASASARAYRYHQLFREFLRDRLGAAERNSLLRRAAICAQRLGDLDGAVEYFIAAGAHKDSAVVIREAGEEAFRRGRWLTVARWLDSLPAESLLDDPWLLLYRGKVEIYRGRLGEAENWVARGAAILAAREDAVGVAESQLLQARILRGRGRFQESLELLEQAEPFLLQERKGRRFDLPLEKSLILFMTARFEDAEALLSKELAEAEREDDSYVIAHLAEGLGNVYYMLGDYAKALRTYRRGAEASPERVLSSYYALDSISTIYEDWGEIQRAFEYAKRNAEITEKLGLTEALPSAYIQLATIYADLGQLKVAEDYYRRAINLARENGSERFYLALNLTWLARCLGLQGRWVEARAEAEDALREASDQGSLVWAVCREVTAQVFMQSGSMEKGIELLRDALAFLENSGFRKAVCHGYITLAWAGFETGDRVLVEKYAPKSLELAARLNYVYYFLTSYDQLKPILSLGLEKGIEVTFIQRLLVRLGRVTLDLLLGLTAHPDPEVRKRAVVPLAEIGGPQAKKVIRRLLEDPDKEMRALCLSVSRRLGINAAVKRGPAEAKVSLLFECLGPLRVFAGGVEMASTNWRTVNTRDFLAYLMHRGEPVRRETILEDLWPESDPRRATPLFHTTLYYLREALDKACRRRDLIIYGNGQYQLVPECYATDRRRFEELLAAVAAADEENTPEAAAVHLEEAVALWRGEYLEDLDYGWILPIRENLRRLHIDARQRLGRFYLRKRDFSRAILHLRFLTQVSPFSEEGHRLLMTAYAGAGDRQAVKGQYLLLATTLGEELGLSPSAATKQLYYRLIGREEKRTS